MPPVHLSGSRSGTRTAVVSTLVIRKSACTLGRLRGLSTIRRLSTMPLMQQAEIRTSEESV